MIKNDSQPDSTKLFGYKLHQKLLYIDKLDKYIYTPQDKNIRPSSKMKKKILFTIFKL